MLLTENTEPMSRDLNWKLGFDNRRHASFGSFLYVLLVLNVCTPLAWTIDIQRADPAKVKAVSINVCRIF